MKKGLNATQLKIIAIIAMTIDHTAWGFVEMFSVQGQIMHVIGRLTIPIMSFFIAEGYRKTSNIQNYIKRMSAFAVVSVIPFYMFFGEEYGYRQNFIFDLLLALLLLYVVDNHSLAKPQKVIYAIGLFVISLTIGGWPVFPMLGVLIFYYIKDFKKQALVYGGTVVFLVCFMSVTIYCNSRFGWSLYDSSWVWYQWTYFLGFILALPLIGSYNGEKGEYPIGRLFFFFYYPAHFIVLYVIKLIMANDIRHIYMGLHVICLTLAFTFLINLIQAKPSKAATTGAMLTISGMIYIFGFILEVSSGNQDVMYSATIVEYFGEVLLLLSFLWFMSEFCQVKISYPFYALMVIAGVIINYLVITAPKNHIFYTAIGVDSSGPFPRIDLTYGPGFFLFDTYAAGICVIVIGNCITLMRKSKDKLIQKRAINMLLAICCPWIAFAIKLTGITGGYEVSSVGCLGAIYFIYSAMIKYEFFDSIQLAGENAIHRFGGGMMVVDPGYVIKYMNLSMKELFPGVNEGDNIEENTTLWSVFQGDEKSINVYGRIFDFENTTLIQNEFLQGYLLTSKDMTEHYAQLEQAERLAQRDVLTGLYNRVYFSKYFNAHRELGGVGCVLMFDLDNFKGVNDSLGHEAGDKILIAAAETLKEVAENKHVASRLGGDEYIMYIKDENNREVLGAICTRLQETFAKKIADIGYADKTSMSIGGVILNQVNIRDEMEDFAAAYRKADKMLYEAKNSGKSTYRLE